MKRHILIFLASTAILSGCKGYMGGFDDSNIGFVQLDVDVAHGEGVFYGCLSVAYIIGRIFANLVISSSIPSPVVLLIAITSPFIVSPIRF